MCKVQQLKALVNKIFWLFERTIAEYEQEIVHCGLQKEALEPEIRRNKAVIVVPGPSVSASNVSRRTSSSHSLKTSRALVKERLAAVAGEIFGLFERTIAEYEKEVSHSKEENDWQRKLLDAVLHPEVQLQRAALPADVQQLLVSKEEVPPEQQKWSPCLDQENPEPPHIKEEQEEQEELWPSEEEEQPHQSQTEEIREAEPPASSSTEQVKTEADGEDCGEPEPARNLDPAGDLQPTRDDKTSDSSEPETEDSDDDVLKGPYPGSYLLLSSGAKPADSSEPETEDSDDDVWKNPDPASDLQPDSGVKTSDSSDSETEHRDDVKEIIKPQSGLDSVKKTEVLVSHSSSHTGEKNVSCGTRFGLKANLEKRKRSHRSVKRFTCTACGKGFDQKRALEIHVRIHTGEKPFSCSVCGKRFVQKGNVKVHMKIHSGEKTFRCSVCGIHFNRDRTLRLHARSHAVAKPR